MPKPANEQKIKETRRNRVTNYVPHPDTLQPAPDNHVILIAKKQLTIQMDKRIKRKS